MTKKQYKNMKDTIGLGVGSMAGMGVMGAMGSIPGMPANNITGTVGAGLGLANVGQLAKTGMGVVGMFGSTKSKKISKDKKGKNCVTHRAVKNILGR